MAEETTARGRDTAWVRQAFFKRGGNRGYAGKALGGAGTNSADINSSYNFYDTTLGGNRVLNPPPQFCRWSDPKVNTIASGCRSMGQGYKEAIDDNAQRISLQFGIPKYNSMTSFMSNFYSPAAAAMAKYGTVNGSVFHSIGYTAGVLFTLPLQTFFGINHLVNRISAAISGNPYSKFYYMQPTMALYWNAVALMFNKLAVDMGVMDPVAADEIKDGKIALGGQAPSKVDELQRLLPDVFLGGGGENESGSAYIDVKAIASRSQRMANQFNEALYELENGISTTGEQAREQYVNGLKNLGRENALSNERPQTHTQSMNEYTGYFGTDNLNNVEAENQQALQAAKDRNTGAVAQDGGPAVEKEQKVWNDLDSLWKYMKADLQEGSAFVSFHVDKTGPISHSFSNTTKEAPLKETANGVAQQARDIQISMFGGNIGDNVVFNAMESTVGAIKDLVAGAVSSIGIGLEGALSGAMMDMSDVYDNSSAEIASQDYSMTFATPYGNKFSILTRVYLPLCCILAGVLPRRSGKNSYVQPFLCRLHSQAFEDIRLGIISSVNIELGTSNIGRQINQLPTAIKVTMTVENMDKMMSVPLSDSVLDSITSFSAFDEDTTLTDFLGSLAGVSMYDQYFAVPRLKRAWKKTVADWNTFASPTYFSQWFAGTIPGKTVSAFLKAGDI
ncbi:hypothetical protein CZP2022_250 [Vibrio phage C-ZP2022]|nr:hypothetical protein CZP2022_250 [Vibrio phage C-ZP2022]